MNKKSVILRPGAFLMALTVLFSTTGCASGVHLSRRAIVQAVAVDYDSGQYVATLQLYGIEGESPDKQSTQTMELRGDTLTSLLTEGGVREGKQLFLGSLQILLLGEDLAREHAGEALRFFNAYPQIQPTLPVAVVEGRAGELLLNADSNPSLSARGLLNTLNSAEKAGLVPQARLMDVVGGMEGGGSLLPLFHYGSGPEQEMPPGFSGLETGDPLLNDLLRQEAESAGESSGEPESGPGGQNNPEEEKELTLVGGAIFEGDNMDRTISPTEARGFSWLSGKGKSAVLSVELPELGRAVAVTDWLKVQVTPEVMADSLVFRIRLEVRASLLETTMREEDVTAHLAELRELFSRKIRMETESALSATCRRGYDPMNLGGLVKQRIPAFYKEHGDEWEDTLQDAGYSVDVKFLLERKTAI